jgi:hypothetical protein
MIRKNEMFIYILIALSILVTECKSKPVFKENRYRIAYAPIDNAFKNHKVK